MRLKAVVFDVGGVLEIVEDLSWLESWRTRLEMAPSAFQAALDDVDRDGLIETGGVSEAAYLRRYAHALGLSAPQLASFREDMWNWYCGTLDRELMEFARSLRPSYVTAILSNSADGARREEQARYDFAAVFDPIIYSHEVGLVKPDRRVYHLACDRMRVQPPEAVLLDDVPANVNAAREVGMHAVLHRATPESIADLRALLDGPVEAE